MPKRKLFISIVIFFGLIIGILLSTTSDAAAQNPDPNSPINTGSLLDPLNSLPGIQFIHTATASNITNNWTDIDHPLINNNPNAIIFVTQNWNPAGQVGIYNDHAIGVWYNGPAQRWAIFNQDLTSMSEGAAFNVLIPNADLSVFVHTASAANTTSNWTEINNPLTNNNPNALVLITQNWNPGDTTGVYNDHSIGVWYDNFAGRWAIFNQDIAAIPEGADFNVIVPTAGSSVFLHTASPGNIVSNWTEFDHPQTNNNPHATVFVTQNWNPGDSTGVYNDHKVGVWYRKSTGRWAVFNQDLTAMPPGADFNVIVSEVKSFVPLVLH